MKDFGKNTNVYFVSTAIAFFSVMYLVSLVVIQGDISNNSSAKIYKERLLQEQGKKDIY